MVVAIRFEMTKELYENAFEQIEGIGRSVPNMFPGMNLTPPREEGDKIVFEMTVPDEIAPKDVKDIVLAQMSFQPESKYDYNMERRFTD